MYHAMVCKITFIKKRQSKNLAFTLVEFLIAMGVSALLMGVVSSFMLYSGKSFAGISNYVDLEKNSQRALDTLTRDVRQASSLSTFTTNKLTFIDGDGGTLIFEYSPTARTLTKTKGGTNSVLLTECDLLLFSIYQRNPISGTYEEFPTAAAATCKLINVNWVCSRTILGTKLTTESVQTAKVVLRKENSIIVR